MHVIIAFILGFVIATVGFTKFASFVDSRIENTKEIIRENVK
jgi:capsular polysaccharide biosynthesis protein